MTSGERRETHIDLNTGDDTSILQVLDKRGTIFVVLEESLLVQDSTGDVVTDLGGGEKETTVSLTVGLVVLNTNGLETLADGLGGLINS